ncbi:MAG: aminotransferase class I/II-fold pyridoxal phosphate-dependent enzyme [Deltaproteobacteria bacterium]|jgi:LL-diaminopimelate aminotransferase|nr:aminotransferase class I/II-fold pyridoxal phosphate-dependent enzyme [Deltaproteobacteria bacterium]
MPRTDIIQEYLFASIDEKLEKLAKKGIDVISFGVGDPDSPPPEKLINKLGAIIKNKDMHNYSPYVGTLEFRQSAAAYMHKRYGVNFNPNTEVVGLIGSKEGIGNTVIAYTQKGSLNLVPSLSYPIPRTMTKLAGGKVFSLHLTKENNFLVDFDKIPVETANQATLLYLNYPNNPTGVGAELDFYEKALAFAEKHDLIIISDNAYGEIYFDTKPHSFFEIAGAKKRVLEYHSLSKMFNITGWRLAFALGSPQLLKPLKVMKTNMDSGQFKPLQLAAGWALENLIDDFGEKQRKTYRQRLNALKDELVKLGAKVELPGGTFFLWGETPEGMSSNDFTEFLLEKYGIFVTPGNMFGEDGEGFFRASLTVSDERLQQALARFK